MHRYSRMHLSPEVALRNLDAIDLEEKSRIAEGIALIAVIDHRRDYLAAGYSCMRDYCMGRLHMSEDKAFRRIQVARVALRFAEVFEYLADGRLNVGTASALAPHLQPGTAAELLMAAAFRSRHDILRLIAERSRPEIAAQPEAAVEPGVETSSSSLAPGQVNSLTDLCAPLASGTTVGQHAPAHVQNSRRGRVTHSGTGGREVRLSITDDEYADLCAAQALLGHAVPSGDPALVYARAMKLYRAHLEKQRLGVKPGASVPAGNGRSIPRPLRRLVWERDGGRCAFVSADGHRCEETGRLEIDHIRPVTAGGGSTPDNLRVLCRAHNQYEAERVLGREHVQRRRELAQRERARDRVAAAAGVARATARDTAMQARHDDIHGALRGLGFRGDEARRGAAMADAVPEASLEACIKLALTELTRPVAARGERRARYTA